MYPASWGNGYPDKNKNWSPAFHEKSSRFPQCITITLEKPEQTGPPEDPLFQGHRYKIPSARPIIPVTAQALQNIIHVRVAIWLQTLRLILC